MIGPTLLYLKGPPGSGKITVARILERDLGWPLFWHHNLDFIMRIVGSEGMRQGKMARFMDGVAAPILRFLLEQRKSFIYVRPSRDAETVRMVCELVDSDGSPDDPRIDRPVFPHHVCIVNLWAPYDTLLKRVEERTESLEFRVCCKAELDEYLQAREAALNAPGECTVNTDRRTPEEVAEEIKWMLGIETSRNGVHGSALAAPTTPTKS